MYIKFYVQYKINDIQSTRTDIKFHTNRLIRSNLFIILSEY